MAFLGLALFFGAMRFEGFRPLGARFVGLALPVATVWAAQSKLVDTHPALRRAALLLGSVVLARGRRSGGAGLLRGPLTRTPRGDVPPGPSRGRPRCRRRSKAIAARRSLRVRVAAWFGIALGFAGYLAGVEPSHAKQQLGVVFVASLVGLWAGGLGGLVLGAGAARLARTPRKAEKAPACS